MCFINMNLYMSVLCVYFGVLSCCVFIHSTWQCIYSVAKLHKYSRFIVLVGKKLYQVCLKNILPCFNYNVKIVKN